MSSLTSDSALFTVVSPTSATYYCIFVTDSASIPVTVNSINSEVTVNPALSTPTISPSNPTIDSGQSVSFTTAWSGGTPTYGASLYSSPTSTCNQQSTLVQQQIGLSSSQTTFNPVSPNANTYYCTYVTDNLFNSPSVAASITSGVSGPFGVSISPSGAYAYLINLNSVSVAIINTATNTVTASITSGFDGPQGVALSPSGTYAYVTNANSNNVVIINTATNTVTGAITSGLSSPEWVAFSPSGTYAYVTNTGSNNVVIINTATNTVTGSITSGISFPQGVAFSPSGTYAYVTNTGSNNVVIINTATNTVINSITSGFNAPQEIAFSPSGTYAYVTNYLGNNVVIINTATNTVTASITSGFDGPEGVAFSPSGAYTYVTNYGSNNVVIINTGVTTTNSINSYVTLKQANSGTQVTNPYAGGSTGFFGHLPGTTASISSTSTTVTTSLSTTVPTIPVITPSGTTTTSLCNDIVGYYVNYPSLNATFHLSSGTTRCFNVTATNATAYAKTLNNPKHILIAINYSTSNKNISSNATMHYPCTVAPSNIAPFILENKTWQKIIPFTINSTACTVEFAIPSDPIIAILNTSQTTTNTISTNATTTIQTTIATSNAPVQPLPYALIAAIVIVIVVLFIYFRSKR